MDAKDKRDKKQPKTALMYAVDLLSRQEHSAKRLREKLGRKGYGAEETAAAIASLQEKKYLNDEEACQNQFRRLYEESRHSVRQICFKLRQYGFDGEVISRCIPADSYEREKKAALRSLAIKFKSDSPEVKMRRNLYTKGFSAEVINDALHDFMTNGYKGENIEPE
ncbi:MAG: regulatory protein RecX [Selenomonadaceae bacterium]|nr:regulatory protein RecX [Selenomonadaceae bacterium]